MMKFLILLLAFLGLQAQAQNCDIFQVRSTDKTKQKTRLGNAFSYSDRIIVVNDHSLTPNAESVTLKQGNKSWTAQVLKRDFHTDLAILQVPMESFRPCPLTNEAQDHLLVVGYDQNDAALSKTPVLLKTAESTKLMVPGVTRSLEFMGEGQSRLRSGQSGSLVLSGNKVAGLVTQKTSEGTALAIRSDDLNSVVKQMIEGRLPERPYKVDLEKGTIHFRGLRIGTGGIDPHGAPTTNPLTNKPASPEPIALEDYDVGAVLADVEDFALLEKAQPQLARALREARVSRVFVSSVDGKPVKNTLEFLRALGTCQACVIDSFWIEVKNPQSVQNTTLRLMGWFAALIVELEKDNAQKDVAELVQSIQKINPVLAKTLNESGTGKLDPRHKIEVRRQWSLIEKSLDQFWHSEKTLDILSEIRQEMEKDL